MAGDDETIDKVRFVLSAQAGSVLLQVNPELIQALVDENEALREEHRAVFAFINDDGEGECYPAPIDTKYEAVIAAHEAVNLIVNGPSRPRPEE